MDDKSIVEMAVLAGEIMLRSGAETYRVEDTMKHILGTTGTAEAEALVMLTSIMVTVSRPGEDTVTVMRRVYDRGTNMHRIVEVNEISRKYCAGELSAEEARKKLKNIKGKQYTTWMYNLATVMVPAGFAPLFGGGLAEFISAAAAGVILAVLMTIGKRIRLGGFVLNVLCAAGVAAAAAVLKVTEPVVNMDTVIISSIMPMVPGVAITNAIRDTLRGDYISGGARALEAFVTAADGSHTCSSRKFYCHHRFRGAGGDPAEICASGRHCRSLRRRRLFLQFAVRPGCGDGQLSFSSGYFPDGAHFCKDLQGAGHGVPDRGDPANSAGRRDVPDGVLHHCGRPDPRGLLSGTDAGDCGRDRTGDLYHGRAVPAAAA